MLTFDHVTEATIHGSITLSVAHGHDELLTVSFYTLLTLTFKVYETGASFQS